jgi:pyrroline-5-carboxylate reductase
MSSSGGNNFPASLLLVGAGRMGSALLQGWLNRGLEPGGVYVLDPAPAADVKSFCLAHGVHMGVPSTPPEVVVLAVKPQTLAGAAAAVAPLVGPQTLVLSILAGKTLEKIGEHLPSARAIVRAMPNLPASIGAGISGAAANESVTPVQKKAAQALLAAGGHVEWLENEGLIDVVTAVSGSGPAYVFYLAECLAEAGAAQGLPADVAARLARATIEGAGALLTALPDATTAKLRADVTSPGGTTAAALAELQDKDALPNLIGRAVAAARQRAQQLSD